MTGRAVTGRAVTGALLVFVLAGCGRTRVVTIPGETPPPTVQLRTDTLYLASPPDTVFAPPETVSGGTVTVTETVPVEVVRYLEPRQDTSRAFLLWQISVDSARVEIAGAAADASYRRPVPGERLRCIAAGPSTLECRVEGEPVAAPARRVECPACAGPLIARGVRGWLTLMGLLVVAASAGAVAVAVAR